MEEPCPLTGEIIEVTMAFPDGCFREGTPILLEDNTEKPIENVKVGDRVLSHNCYGEVTKTFIRPYNGEMIIVKPRGSRGLHVTPEHPFYVVKRNKREFPAIEPEWLPARDLREGYWLVSPIAMNIEDVDGIDLTKFIDFKGKKKKVPEGMLRYKYSKRLVPRYIKLTGSFLRIIGYYLAEGNLFREKGVKYNNPEAPRGVNFTFSIDEEDYAEDVVRGIQDSFGLKACVQRRKNKSTIDIKITSIPVAMLFEKLAGEHFDGKSIHPLLMKLPPEKQAYIVQGLHSGDNSDSRLETNKGEKGILLRNTILIQQIWTILNRLRKKPAHYRSGKAEIVAWKDVFSKDDRFYFKDWLITPIRTLDRYNYKGLVCNLAVSPHESYVAQKIAVHNCNGLVALQFGHGGLAVLPSKKEEFIALNNSTPTFRNLRESVTKGERLWAILRNGDAANPHKPSIIIVINGVE